MNAAHQKPSFREALKFWMKLGFISFGGPAGQIAIMHEFLVEKKKWISDSKFLHALNYCMLLPGPEAQQLSIYTGWMLHGIKGGVVAGVLFVLPAMIILCALSIIYVLTGSNPWIVALFEGLKPAVIAIVILALYKIGKKSLQTYFHYFMALAAFICIFFLHISFPIIILASITLAWILQKTFPDLLNPSTKAKAETELDETSFVINKYTVIEDSGFNPGRFWTLIITGLLLWILPVSLFFFLSGDFSFWKTLTLFFTQAAFVTFGGAYAVLPYVAQVSVDQLMWLTKLQMMDGLALGETTPGPLIIVLSFVGFMAGYNHFEHNIILSILALLMATFYTFLPSFLFILAGAPLIERTRENEQVRKLLQLVSAAVVGVVLNLTIYLAQSVIFNSQVPDWNELNYIALTWIVISIVALHNFKINMIVWIGISGLFGLGLKLFW
jgi:chromate transporter